MAHPADLHEVLRVEGAREHNLRDVSLEVPKRRLTVFTGVSGSGKSSLVFGTIAAESQRLINETYPAFVQGFMPQPARPEVDALHGLTPVIAVDQEPLAANARSTVGTVTDAHPLLRTLFSRLGEPFVGPPTAFSFNVPTRRASGVMSTERAGGRIERATVKDVVYLGGMCPECEGRGTVSALDLSVIVDESRSLAEGAILVPGYTADGWMVAAFKAVVPPDVPIRDLTTAQRDDLLHGATRKVRVENVNVTYQGLIPKIRASMFAKDPDSLQPHVRAFVERAATVGRCAACDGTRLSEAARSSRVRGASIADVCAWQVGDAAAWVRDLDEPSTAPVRRALLDLLDSFVEIGLGYLALDRPSGSLSGGEAQRLRMIRHLGSALTDVTYVFDEPTAGLHPHDVDRMNRLLLRLRDKGNTVLVVEHKPETIAIADHVVDLGPGAGARGGELCFEGTVEALRASDTLTGRHLADRARLKPRTRTPSGVLEIRGADRNNLRDVDVDLPLGVLCALTGVAGSGKSSLVQGSIAARDDVVVVDQTAIRGSRRSNPATYTGLLEPVRKAFAKANGVKPALFSANSEGACPTCHGSGVIDTELGFMETVSTPCDDCGGRRFQPAVLELLLGGLSIADVHELAIDDALAFFSAADSRVPAAVTILERLVAVGLGYLTLGQPLSSLSGGERQRLKLAVRMAEPGGVVVLDEPTTGLHLADVAHLLALLDRLVDGGRSVIVVEHHLAVVAHADWVIDLGPGAGHDGGRVVFTGTPAALTSAGTVTGEHLARYVDG
ncbi:excinuclease ABC subunit UvrA [Nocardioides sp. TRM66260-LWL]|uniref:ATP-binding cassette domain-containing protein n=1 Tax=Nocardioides sp. TRM66260-LWL TaxID=2874478 RepID=UPI001CC3A852|nr:excinuclease ABC subunit UvrA [Nocardioides sp. TRM66260-LWL]MBZ5734006.1 excinuclease ABC subunit UvrA [Nocardioides sp. TRM66260-LWL]